MPQKKFIHRFSPHLRSLLRYKDGKVMIQIMDTLAEHGPKSKYALQNDYDIEERRIDRALTILQRNGIVSLFSRIKKGTPHKRKTSIQKNGKDGASLNYITSYGISLLIDQSEYAKKWSRYRESWKEYEMQAYGELRHGIWDINFHEFLVNAREHIPELYDSPIDLLQIDNAPTKHPFHVILLNFNNWHNSSTEEGRKQFEANCKKIIPILAESIKGDQELLDHIIKQFDDEVLRLEELVNRERYLLQRLRAITA
jgi:hypothetical protein